MSKVKYVDSFSNEFINDNEDLYVNKHEKRMCSYNKTKKQFEDLIPKPEMILLNETSSINGRVEIPMLYRGVHERKLIIQWGRIDVTSGDNIVQFNESFPNAIYNVQATPNYSNINVGIDKIDKATCKINSNGSGRVYWIAIGQ